MTRTAEQHMADVAAHTLKRLAALQLDLANLASQLGMLSGWASNHELDEQADYLDHIAATVSTLNCCVPEAVRDIAATLPLRGLEFGATQ